MTITIAKRSLLPMLIGLAFAPASHAEFRITPGVELRETWTDNVNLAPEGQARSEFVTELTPGFTIAENNRRLRLFGSYRYHYFAYSDPDAPRLRAGSSELNAGLNARLVEDLLYLDASANRGQQAISAFGPQLNDNAYTTINRTNVSSWRVSPYLTRHLGASATLLARYTRSSVDTGHDGFGNTDGDAVDLALSSAAQHRLGWNLRYGYQRLSDRRAGDSSSKMANAGLSWRVSAPLALTANVGYDEFDYGSLGGRARGANWNVGYRYTPSARTELSMNFGHRYFGKSRALTALHRSRHTVWSIGYDESVTTTRAQFLLPASVDTASLLDRLFTANYPDPELRREAVEAYLRSSGLPPVLTSSVNYLSNRYMLQQQFHASAAFTGVRTVLLASLYDTRRHALSLQQTDSDLLGNSQISLNDDTRQRGIGVDLRYRLSSRTEAFAAANASRAQSLSTGIRQSNRALHLGLQSKIQRRLQGTLELRRVEGLASASRPSHVENAVSASLTMTY